MTTIMPKDDDNNPIPALRLKDGASHKILATNTSTKNAVPFSLETKVISVFTTQNIYLEFGDDTVSASVTSHFFPAGVYYDFAINTNKHAKDLYMAVLKEGASDATVYISEKE